MELLLAYWAFFIYAVMVTFLIAMAVMEKLAGRRRAKVLRPSPPSFRPRKSLASATLRRRRS